MPRANVAKKAPNPIFQIVMETAAVICGELYPISAPQTVGNFISLANSGFYDGLCFHRCIHNFIVQGGQSHELPYCIKGEFEFNRYKNNRLKHEYGSLCMSRSGHYDSAGSQFFIVVSHDGHELNCLNGAYAVFGKVLDGMKVVDAISVVDTDGQDRPIHPQLIRRIRVETFGMDFPFEKLPPPCVNINQPSRCHVRRNKTSGDIK